MRRAEPDSDITGVQAVAALVVHRRRRRWPGLGTSFMKFQGSSGGFQVGFRVGLGAKKVNYGVL